jgi:hypothetical protein
VTETRFWNVAGNDAGPTARAVATGLPADHDLRAIGVRRVRASAAESAPGRLHSCCCWGLLAVTGVVWEPVA